MTCDAYEHLTRIAVEVKDLDLLPWVAEQLGWQYREQAVVGRLSIHSQSTPVRSGRPSALGSKAGLASSCRQDRLARARRPAQVTIRGAGP